MIPIQDTIPRRNPPVATYILILINSLVFMFEVTLPPPMREQLFHLLGVVPARYTHPDWAVWVGATRSYRRLARGEYGVESAWVPCGQWRVP